MGCCIVSRQALATMGRGRCPSRAPMMRVGTWHFKLLQPHVKDKAKRLNVFTHESLQVRVLIRRLQNSWTSIVLIYKET